MPESCFPGPRGGFGCLYHTFESVILAPMDQPMAPTLWRTCRTLANHARLQVLRFLFDRGTATVGETAVACDLSMDKASLMLRQLQARGLLSAQLHGRRVVYRAVANPGVRGASRLTAVLRVSLRNGGTFDEVVRALTAFTHPRRIRLVRALRRSPLGARDLQEACMMSRPAFQRHMRKLRKRLVVGESPTGCCLLKPASPLAAELLRSACGAPGA